MRGMTTVTLVLASATIFAGSGCLFFDVDEDGDGPPGGNSCGDGFVNSDEQCDDGNGVAGDGCFQCELEARDNAYVTANWTFRNEATSTITGCPSGFDTVAVYNQQVDAGGANIGAPVIDLFDCVAGNGTTAALPGGFYSTWIEVTTATNSSVYARSVAADLDLTVSDKSFNAQILNDGGYFKLAWTLVGASTSNILTCAQAGAEGDIDVIATDISDSSNSASDTLDCELGSGYTAGYRAATYTVSVSAMNSSNTAIGTAPALTNRVINIHNAVTDLGTVEIPITGL